MHARHFLISERELSIHDSCRFDVERFRTEPNNYQRSGVYTRSVDTFARRSDHHNSLITLRVIHEKLRILNPIFKIIDQYLH